jgi:hypothetical protein
MSVMVTGCVLFAVRIENIKYYLDERRLQRVKVRTYFEGIWEQGVEENILT